MNRPTGGGPSRSGVAERGVPTGVFLRGLATEMRRVTWPSRQEWIAATILTVALVAAIGLYTYLLDDLFGALFSAVHK